MNDIRRSILWVIFGFALILLWDQWQVHNGRPATFFPSQAPAVAASGAASGAVPAATAAANGASAATASPAAGTEEEIVPEIAGAGPTPLGKVRLPWRAWYDE